MIVMIVTVRMKIANFGVELQDLTVFTFLHICAGFISIAEY